MKLREPGLRPTWGPDAEHPPAADAHEGTEEHIRDAHRDRHAGDCGNSGMSPDFDILQSLVGDASPLETDGSDSDQPAGAVVTYAHYACVADCADAMADAWEDTAGCAQPICLHENLLK